MLNQTPLKLRALLPPRRSLVRQFWADEAGFLLSAELVLILTLGAIAMVVGLNAVAKSVVQELNDVAQGGRRD